MPIDASIPLQIRPTQQLNDPLETYSKMLSLRHMQAQAEQQQKLAPLVLQQHQAALKMANLQAQDMERQIQKEKDIAAITKDAYGPGKAPATEGDAIYKDPPAVGKDAIEKAPPVSGSDAIERDLPAAGVTSAATPPAGAGTLQPASALQSAPAPEGMPTTVPQSGPRVVPQPDDTFELGPESQPGTAPPPTAAALQPLAAMQGPAAPATAPPVTTPAAPAPQETQDQKFVRLMNERGHGQDVARIMQQRAISQESQIKLQEMQREQKDHEIWETVGPKGGGDPEKTLKLAIEAGMSQKSQAAIRKSMQDAVNAHLLERSRLSDAETKERTARDARWDDVAQRMTGLLKRDDQGMKDNWSNFVQQLAKDKLTTPEEQAALVKLNGGEFPGRKAVQGYLDEHASQKWVKTQADIQLAAAKEKEAEELHKRTRQHQEEMEAQGRERNKISKSRADAANTRETSLGHKELISRLADQATAESYGSGGSNIDHVLANVEDTKNYQGHPIGESRGEVAAELRKRKDAKLNTAGKEIKVDEAAAKKKLLDSLDPDKSETPKPTGGGRGNPAVKPTVTPNPAPPAATPAPAPAAGQQADITWADGRTTRAYYRKEGDEIVYKFTGSGSESRAKAGQIKSIQDLPASPAATAGRKVDDVVSIRGVKHKITKVYPDGHFDADPVQQ
jgi:hypothetical protein